MKKETKFWLIAAFFALMFGATVVFANQTVSSTRDSTHEWRCETADGVLISGHVRQDKAQQACWNQALKNPGVTYITRGGTYRSIASAPDVVVVPPGDPTSVTLKWQAPTKFVDGTSIGPGDLTAYMIWLESPTATLIEQIAPGFTRYVFEGSGQHCFSVSAVAEAESARSNTVCREL
jgi:hypothetical protein